MLGHLVAAYLADQGCNVVTSELRYQGKPGDRLLRELQTSACPWVINAIGLIKQKSSDRDLNFLINTVLPMHILQEMRPDQRLIHASTDCVFSGRRGWYAKDDPKDAEDVYGLSKALGEQAAVDPRALVMRVSIIGPDLGSGAGLFVWFMKQSGVVKGYTNHFWNGITTLEWAKAAWEVIQGKAPVSHGLVQLGVPQRHSKHELLRLVKGVWARDITIEEVAPDEAVDRTLEPDWERAPLRDQLTELRAWIELQKVAGERPGFQGSAVL